MNVNNWRFLRLSVTCALLAIMIGNSIQATLADGCTVTVVAGDSVQDAIDSASSGAVICLATGTLKENLKINKSVTLRGDGPDNTKVEGREPKMPVIEIQSNSEIQVTIEFLTVAKGKSIKGTGLHIRGKAGVVIQNVHAVDNDKHGIAVTESASVSIANSKVSRNYYYGILTGDSAHLTVTDSEMSENYIGFTLVGGLVDSQVQLINSHIFQNRLAGIAMKDQGSLTVQNSVMEANGTKSGCNVTCNGIHMRENTHLTLIDSLIRKNAGWGISVELKKCGEPESTLIFIGTVTFQGANVIEDNNQSTALKGMGNPGNHPWNQPDVPDGQVCLP